MKDILSLCIGLLWMSLACAQNVGVGTTMPIAKLDIHGTFRIADGTQGAGKVLTSDASGLASWKTLPSLPAYFPVTWICCNRWMTKNLDVSKYRNGDPIPKVTGNAAWAALTTGAYCYFNNDSTTYAATYGKLYNWYAVNDPRGLAPEGWHIPSKMEWDSLISCVGGSDIAGGILKEVGTSHWVPPNSDGSNIANFTGLPGGWRGGSSGLFQQIGITAFFWSTSPFSSTFIWYTSLSSGDTMFYEDFLQRYYGCSVRCIKD